MTTKTTKTVLFAALILSFAVPFASFNLVEAQTATDDQARTEIKKQQIAQNTADYKDLRIQTDSLENSLAMVKIDIAGSGSVDIQSLNQQRDSLKSQIDSNYEDLDRIEKISQSLHKIPLEKERLLESTVKTIVDKYEIHTDDNPDGLLEDVFIDAENEVIYVLKNVEDEIRKNTTMQNAISSMESEIHSLATDDRVKIIVTEIKEESSCNYDSERDDYCQPAAGGVKIQGENFVTGYIGTVETSTLSFPATRNSVSGFVMIGHGTLSQDGGEDIHQPTKSGSTNKIGDLVVGFDNSDCDCSFIDLSPGRTVDAEVVSNTIFNWDIDQYISASSQSVGTYIYMSGLESGVELGQIKSKPSDTNRIYADYTSDEGDSGAPVGKVLSGEIDIYGIHEGTVVGSSWKQYVPYDVIEDELGLD